MVPAPEIPVTTLPGGACIWPVPAFRDNYIWVLEDRGRATVIDPGEAAPVQRARGLVLDTIVVTHHHADHVGGIAELTAGTSVRIVGPRRSPYTGSDTKVGEGDCVTLAGHEFTVMEVPGHTLDHVAYRSAVLGLLLCGDTLFSCGCGRLFEGTAPQLHGALRRFAALPPSTLVFCTHEYTSANIRFARAVEPDNAALAARSAQCDALRAAQLPTLPSTMGQELATNPFLRCAEPTVRVAVRNHAGTDPGDETAVFAALRAWKDVFQG